MFVADLFSACSARSEAGCGVHPFASWISGFEEPVLPGRWSVSLVLGNSSRAQRETVRADTIMELCGAITASQRTTPPGVLTICQRTGITSFPSMKRMRAADARRARASVRRRRRRSTMARFQPIFPPRTRMRVRVPHVHRRARPSPAPTAPLARRCIPATLPPTPRRSVVGAARNGRRACSTGSSDRTMRPHRRLVRPSIAASSGVPIAAR